MKILNVTLQRWDVKNFEAAEQIFSEIARRFNMIRSGKGEKMVMTLKIEGAEKYEWGRSFNASRAKFWKVRPNEFWGTIQVVVDKGGLIFIGRGLPSDGKGNCCGFPTPENVSHIAKKLAVKIATHKAMLEQMVAENLSFDEAWNC